MNPQPPVARRERVVHRLHGDERPDDYAWLADRSNPDVIAYLEEENAYTKAVMARTEALQKRLFEEVRSRVQETDVSAPVRHGPFRYYSRTVEGLQYAIHCRVRLLGGSAAVVLEHAAPVDRRLPPRTPPAGDVGAEQVLVDENTLAEGHEYFRLGVFEVSPDHRLLAYSTDTEGDEVYELRFRDLDTGEDLPDRIPGTYYSGAWANDNATFFYTALDEAKRPWQVWRHRLGSASPDLVLQEDDEAFHASVEATRSRRFVVVVLSAMITSEIHVLPAGDPAGTWSCVHPREHGLEYYLDHHSDRFYIHTNDAAPNFKLVEALVDDPGKRSWKDVIPHREDVRLSSVDVFAEHLALVERSEARTRLKVMRLSDGDVHEVSQPEEASIVYAGSNPEFDTRVLRFVYSSLVTPWSSFDYDMDARTRELVKQEPVPGYDPGLYVTERLWAEAPDGTRVPISLVHRKDVARDGAAPCLLRGYGAYEHSSDPYFSTFVPSLLDRGFVFAIAHVRGGGDMGRWWYEQGKFLRKMNTFTDFIACAEHLVDEGYTSSDRLVARGGSAGGLLMGAVLNLRPDLFRAVVADVPFVDVLTTLLDPSLPLTVIEWDEWGNPNEEDYYRYIRNYAPYDNVEPKDYPAVLVTAGLNDPRVSYFEPAKWVAKLRATKTDANPLILKTEMGSGHAGPSGRYDGWRDEAFEYSFILDSVGISS